MEKFRVCWTFKNVRDVLSESAELRKLRRSAGDIVRLSLLNTIDKKDN